MSVSFKSSALTVGKCDIKWKHILEWWQPSLAYCVFMAHEMLWVVLDLRLHINLSRLRFWTTHGCYAHWAWERAPLCGHHGPAAPGSSWWRSCSREREVRQKPFLAKRKSSWARRAPSDLEDGRFGRERVTFFGANQGWAVQSSVTWLLWINFVSASRGIMIIMSTTWEERR